MKFINGKSYTASRAWGALGITEFEDATVRLHWTDKPYEWHVNDGREVFVVLDGEVEMHYRKDRVEEIQRMQPGDICYAEAGDEHVAHPIGEARVLVIERKGSV